MKAVSPLVPTVAQLACLSLLTVSKQGVCAWERVPEVRIVVEANDNPRHYPDEGPVGETAIEPASRLIAQAGLELTNYTERHDLSIAGVIRRDFYADDENSELASTDVFLRAGGERRWPRAALGFETDFASEQLLGTEFLEPVTGELGDDIIVDGVLLGLNERRVRTRLSPYTEFQLGERGVGRLDLRLIDVAYDDPLGISSRTDFVDWTAGAEYARALNPRTELAGRIFGSRYEAATNRNTTESLGLEMRLSGEISALWSLSATWGIEQYTFEYFDEASTRITGREDDFIFGIALRKRAEVSTFDFSLRRRIFPDSFGFRIARNELVVGLLRDLSSRLRGGMLVRVIENVPLATQIDGERDYGRLELNLQWEFLELWSLTASYAHSSWSSSDPLGDARSNVVSVGFGFAGRSRRSQTL